MYECMHRSRVVTRSVECMQSVRVRNEEEKVSSLLLYIQYTQREKLDYFLLSTSYTLSQ
jgi:hypothetical protein